MSREQRLALANMNGWIMLVVVTTILGASHVPFLLLVAPIGMFVAAHYQSKFVGKPDDKEVEK